MRALDTMTLAFLFASTTTTASAQELMVLRAPTPPGTEVEEIEEAPAAGHTPYVTIEIQARTGGGSMWAVSNGPGIFAIEGGQAGDMNLGATLSIRHFESGLGLTGGYTHAFTGWDTHYGTHTFDVRLSERATFARSGNFSASVLLEIGAAFMTGGAHASCARPAFDTSDDRTPSACTEHDVSVGGIGGIAAVGLQFRRGVFLGGVEADYRRLVGSGALAQQDDVMVMARMGIAFDL